MTLVLWIYTYRGLAMIAKFELKIEAAYMG